MKHFKQPDALRGIFTLFVIWSHWLGHAGNSFTYQAQILPVIAGIGEIGMYFFFVLSGFLISGILISNRIKAEEVGESQMFVWRNFFMRRTLRIFPIYYATLFFLYYFNVSWFSGPSKWHFLYGSNFYFYVRDGWDLGGHLWSLSSEEQFYIFWPILMLFIPLKYMRNLVLAIILLAPAFRLVLNSINPSQFTQFLTPAVFDGFGLGTLLAIWNKLPAFKKTNDQVKRFANVSGLIGLSIILLFSFKPFSLGIWNENSVLYDLTFRTSHALLGVFFVTGSVNGFKGIWQKLLENRPVLFLGKISYALYLFHNFQLYLFDWFKVPLPTHGLYLIVHFALLVVVCTLSWYLFELPINNLKRFFPYVRRRTLAASAIGSSIDVNTVPVTVVKVEKVENK